MPKLHALLIAINDYHPDSGVSNLDGCINDINAVNAFLKKNYKSLTPAIRILKNRQATRKKIISTFQSHLIKKAKPGDTVLFYYSGHGSYAGTAKAFQKSDPKKQDETLVCYDSRLPGHHDLADKELAVLLSRIADDVHIVVIVDACHSASITRSAIDDFNLGKRRFTAGRSKATARPLDSYLLEGDDYYSDLWKQTKKLTIPSRPHMLLSACDRDQEAFETTDSRGLFSSILLGLLQENKGLSYAQLFAKVRQNVLAVAENQLPTFEPVLGFNPNTVFLRQGVLQNKNRHSVRKINGGWRLDMGAIHGLPTSIRATKKLKVGIYAGVNSTKQLQTASVSKVLLKESVLLFDEADALKQKELVGEIQTMAAPMLVRLAGKAKLVNAFLKKYDKAPSPFVLLDKKAAKAKYTLWVEDKQLVVRLTADKSLIHGVASTTRSGVEYITEILGRVEEWERIAVLRNRQTKLRKAVQMVFIDESNPNKHRRLKGKSITMEYPAKGKDKDANGQLVANNYSIMAKNTSKKTLYLALLHLNVDYQVTPVFNCKEVKGQTDWFYLDTGYGLHIEKEAWNEVTDVFKLIVSTEPFDDYKFVTDGFERGAVVSLPKGKAGTRGRVARRNDEDDWCTHTLTVNTIRVENTISNKDITFSEAGIRIKGHPAFEANVGFAPLQSGARSTHPQAKLAQLFNDPDLQLVNLNASRARNIQDKTIIRLGDISPASERALSQQPLEIEVTQKTTDNDQIIPVTYDGEFAIPFGRSTKEADGTTRISIDRLPDVEDVHRKRSVKKALWFCLLKVTGFRNKAFRLQIAQLNRHGELVRNRAGIPSKVASAKKVLLVVHGIIGDTKGMAKNLQFLVDPKDDDKYDLMLSYDYENLNEPIENIAKELNKRLKVLGFSARDGKQLDIIAHSMGGLVSRYLIEQIRKGDKMVDRLIMLGTPNGGSPFGSIPEYIEMFTTLMTVAINFGKPFLAPIIAYLEALQQMNRVLKATKHLTVTLDQMNSESDFIKKLFDTDNKPFTKYVAIAGDITEFRSDKDSRLGRFIEKVLLQIGDKMNHALPNDIAVAVDQVHDIPPGFGTELYTAVGHHMNYFEEGEAMAMLREWYERG